MSKAVLISIRPEWCAMILRREKPLELRKTAPKIPAPFKCYIYCTNGGRPLVLGDVFRGDWDMDYVQTWGWSREDADRIWGVMNGKVISEFVCDGVEKHYLNSATCRKLSELSCVPANEIHVYAQPHDFVYGWHISDLSIYDTPKELGEFRSWNTGVVFKDGYPMPTHEIKRPPQSWCYVEEL